MCLEVIDKVLFKGYRVRHAGIVFVIRDDRDTILKTITGIGLVGVMIILRSILGYGEARQEVTIGSHFGEPIYHRDRDGRFGSPGTRNADEYIGITVVVSGRSVGSETFVKEIARVVGGVHFPVVAAGEIASVAH